MTTGYHDTRFSEDKRRETVWKALWRFWFSRFVPADGCVIDLGCGYGSFINQVEARRRIALDSWPDFPRHIAPGIETVVGDITQLGFLDDHSVDFAFASNVFEHVTQADFATVLMLMRSKLSGRGVLAILQPNYRYAYKEYFDDYTHIAVYSHISMRDFLEANGYEVTLVIPRFLPLTVKSRLPTFPWLIRAYLALPFKPMGKQMLLVARPRGRIQSG